MSTFSDSFKNLFEEVRVMTEITQEIATLRAKFAAAKPGEAVYVTRREMDLINNTPIDLEGRSAMIDTALPDNAHDVAFGLEHSDGSTASYYELPEEAKELQDLISYKNMNAQMGEIFREIYRHGESAHCDKMRGCKKIKFYIEAEIKRLEALMPDEEFEVEYEEGIIPDR